MPAHRATKAGHPLRDEWPDLLDPVGHLAHPIETAWRACMADSDLPTHYTAPDYFCEPVLSDKKPFAVLSIGGPCRIRNDVSILFCMAGEAGNLFMGSSSPNLENAKVDTTNPK